MAESEKELKKPLDESERGEYIWFHHFMENRWGKQWKQWLTLFLRAPKSLQMVIAAIELIDTCSLEGKL